MAISSIKGCLFRELRHERQIAERSKVFSLLHQVPAFLIKDRPKLPSSPQGLKRLINDDCNYWTKSITVTDQS